MLCQLNITFDGTNYTHVCPVCDRPVTLPQNKYRRNCRGTSRKASECVNRSERAIRLEDKICASCRGQKTVQIKVFKCKIYGECTLGILPGVLSCGTNCEGFKPPIQEDEKMKLSWQYGVTTVPERVDSLLQRTLQSLAKSGFDNPILFVDGPFEDGMVPKWDYQTVIRTPKMRVVANWMLSALELYLRNPRADRYAIFQDDFVTYPNLRQYLDRCRYPNKGYWNLYTFPQEEVNIKGWYPSTQNGKGAVALVFNNEAMRLLLASQYMIDRAQDRKRGHVGIDGAIVSALKNIGWQEYVHNPSLTQHTGLHTSMGPNHNQQPLAPSFKGEEFDPLSLIPKNV